MSRPDHDQIFETLMLGARPQKQKNLQIIHDICAELQRLGSKDFSLATVGRMSEARGGISQRALYNSTSGDFKVLIRAWANFATANKATTKTKPLRQSASDSDLLRKIDDTVLRTLLGSIIAERDRLRGEIQVLKTNTKVTIDRRVLPGHINVTSQGQVLQIMSSAGLSDTEKQALAQAISPDFLQQEGWTEGANGEILNRNGRKLFDIGFANAIRKSLM